MNHKGGLSDVVSSTLYQHHFFSYNIFYWSICRQNSGSSGMEHICKGNEGKLCDAMEL